MRARWPFRCFDKGTMATIGKGVMRTWVWSYLFSKRGARLITEREWRLHSWMHRDTT